MTKNHSAFWTSVRELAALRKTIPEERRALSGVRRAMAEDTLNNPPSRYDIASALEEEAEKVLAPEGRALVQRHLDPDEVFRRLDAEHPEPELEPDWSKPSLAVIASDGKGNGCVLHYVGAHLHQWRSDVGSSLKDLGLDRAPCGISVWEGKTHAWRSYDGDYDAELDGEFREPTPEEWDCINNDDCPWDEHDWVPVKEK